MGRKALMAVAALAAGAAGLAWAARDIPVAYGAEPSGSRADRIRRSPQWRDGAFHNAQDTPIEFNPATNPDDRHRLRELLTDGGERKPSGAIPVVADVPPDVAAADELHITWYGHASSLVEIDGARILFDPIWSDRCSPSRLAGPRRLHDVPIPLAELPAVDAIVISHDHYDHLDMNTIVWLARNHAAPFIVPLGVGAHLERWHVPSRRIIELDWHDSTTVGDLTLTCAPGQHFSGRKIAKRNYTLWSSWVVVGPTHRVFYSGDTGYFDGFGAIGEQYGPFDATLVQIGAYDAGWPSIHMTPEEGVTTHVDVRGGVMIPVHWCTFVLAFHPWGEPADRAWEESKARGVTLAVPRPGQRIDIADPPAVDGWWQTLS
ncbi:MAG TPA: MBL fold metallo-hydrolase [Micromonosporaceae bacterium]|nr:MBL fold metallo-hydrolase [Micromonosporaceae bacterium]